MPRDQKAPESKLVKRFGDEYELKQYDWQVREVLDEIGHRLDEGESEPGFLFVKNVRGESTIEEVWAPVSESIPWLWAECERIK